MKITLPVSALTCLSRFISQEETRYYLNGILIEKHPVKGILIVATDGHRLAVWHETNCIVEDGEWPGESVIVKLTKRELQHLNIKTFAANHFATIDTAEKTVQVYASRNADAEKSAEGKSPLLTMFDMLIDGTYPKWRGVIPPVEKLEPAIVSLGFNAKYLGDFGYIDQSRGMFMRMFKGEVETGPTIILLDNIPQFLGVIMPARHADDSDVEEKRRAILAVSAEGMAAQSVVPPLPETETQNVEQKT